MGDRGEGSRLPRDGRKRPEEGARPPAEDEEGGRGRAWRDVERYLERKALRERLRDVFDEDLPELDLPDDE